MNIRLLIAGILATFIISCSTLSESTSYNYKNHTINVIADSVVDQSFMAVLEPYKAQVDSNMSEVLAYCPNGLVSYRPESPLSNYLSDMLLSVATEYCEDNKNGVIPNVALFNHGGIRSSFPKGDVRVLHAFNIMPFENELVLLQMDGEKLLELANYIATRSGEGIAGMSFGIRNDKAENIKIQGLKVDKVRKYWLVTNDYLASGGDGMKVLTWADKRIDTKIKVRDVIIEYLKDQTAQGKVIEAKEDGRLYYAE